MVCVDVMVVDKHTTAYTWQVVHHAAFLQMTFCLLSTVTDCAQMAQLDGTLDGTTRATNANHQVLHNNPMAVEKDDELFYNEGEPPNALVREKRLIGHRR
jgi:hypothetical protein